MYSRLDFINVQLQIWEHVYVRRFVCVLFTMKVR